MRTITLSALALLLAAPVLSQDAGNSGDWPVKLRGNRYQIWSTATEKEATELLAHMELVYSTYTRLLALAKPPGAKMILCLYKDAETYAAQHGGGSVAHYDGRRLVGFYNKDTMYNYFAHEGFHQFTDVGLKAIDKAGMWFTEGMAECIGNSVVRDKKLYMCPKDGLIAWENIGTIRAMVKSDGHTPIKKLFTLNRNSGFGFEMYCESWSFCHFLMAYPEYEDPKGIQIPNGKHWKVLSRFIQLMSKGDVKHEDAIKLAFVDDKGRPLDLDALEKDWKEYVLNWPIRGKKEEDSDIPEEVLKKIQEEEAKKAQKKEEKKDKKK